MKIYVVGSSKNKFLPLDDIREKFLIDEKHEGDNIDFLNPWYCELTGLYYLWKHVDDDIVGLEHYRRYFVNENGKLLSEDEINEILKTNDVICVKRNIVESNDILFNSLLKQIHMADLNNFLDNINKIDKTIFEFYLKKSHYKTPYNMFICKKEVLNKWCEFIFFNIDKIKNNFNDKNKRYVGYIAEFLLYGFLLKENYKIYKSPMVFKNEIIQ